MRAVDFDYAHAVARAAADQLFTDAGDPDTDLTPAERRGLANCRSRGVALGTGASPVGGGAGRDRRSVGGDAVGRAPGLK